MGPPPSKTLPKSIFIIYKKVRS